MKEISTEKQNNAIEQLFDDYAADLPQQNHLAEKAREYAAACSEARFSANNRLSASDGVRHRRKINIFRFSAVAAVLVAIVIASVVMSVVIGGNQTANHDMQHGSSFCSYGAQDVYELFGSDDMATETTETNVDLPIDGDYILNTYNVYYFSQNNNFAYAMGSITLSDGRQMTFVVENADFVQSDRAAEYSQYIADKTQSVFVTAEFLSADDSGRYVTKGYRALNGFNFYLTVSGESSDTSSDRSVMEYFWNNWNIFYSPVA